MTGRIQKIELVNVGPYKHEEIDFSKNKNSDFIVFEGTVGQGKSTLIDSLKWLLYGTVSGKDQEDLKNDIARKANKEMKVVATFRFEDYTLTLSRSDKKGADAYQYVGAKSLPVNFETQVNRILPPVVQDFFLFHGEGLSQLFNENHAQQMEQAILRLSKVDKLLLIKDALARLANEYRESVTKFAKQNKVLSGLKEEITKWDTAIKDAEKKHQTAQRTKQEKQQQLDMLSERQLSYAQTLGEIKEKIKQREELTGRIESAENELQNERKALKRLFTLSIADGLPQDAINLFLEEIDAMHKRGEVPPPIDPSYVAETLAKHLCKVCGHAISKTQEERLKKLLHATQTAKANLPLYDISVRLPERTSAIKSNIDQFEKTLQKIFDLKKKIKEMTDRVTNLNQYLEKSNAEQIKQIEKTRQNLAAEIQVLEAESYRQKENITTYELAWATANQRFQQESKKVKGNQELSYKLGKVLKLEKLLQNTYDDIRRSLSIELQKSTQKHFDELFKDVQNTHKYTIQIDEHFRIKAMSETGYDRLHAKRLSGGESTSLALSFLMALSTFYGFDFPSFIDAPFSTLSTELRRQLIMTLVKVATEKQVIIFTLPHLEPEIRKVLESKATTYFKFIAPGKVQNIK